MNGLNHGDIIVDKLEWNEAKLKVVRKNSTIQLAFNTESVEELVDVFKTIMFWSGYHPETIDSVFDTE